MSFIFVFVFDLFERSSILEMWRKRDTKKDDGKRDAVLKSTRLTGLSTLEVVDLV